MPKLTSDQAFILAQEFHDLAFAIGNFRFANFDDLSSDERKLLEDLQFDVMNDSTKFNAISIDLALNDLQSTLDDINGATDRMKDAINHLKDVGKVINIATAAVTLGAAIVSMNPGAIASAVSGTVKALNA